MGYIKDMLIEERERLLDAKKAYEADLSSVPKGAIVYKKTGNHKYAYLTWREGNKVKTKYIKQDELESVKHNIFLRERAQIALQNIKENLYTIEHGVGKR